jgi:hypothetical protein
MDEEEKKQYSKSLLLCNNPRHLISACPVAFGEIGVKERIKRILGYKKPSAWIVGIAVIVCILIAVCFMTNQKANNSLDSEPSTVTENSADTEKITDIENSADTENSTEIENVSGDPDLNKYLEIHSKNALSKDEIEWFETEFWDSDDTELLYYNGGQGTYDGWHKDGASKRWIKFLKELPESAVYKNTNDNVLLMSHAGITPGLQVPNNLLWDRDHFNDKWFGKENEIIIHGHTPTFHVWKELGSPKDSQPEKGNAFWYCDNHKICIDVGSYVLDSAVVLDLDTFDEHIFTL